MVKDPCKIRGLSIAATVGEVTDPGQRESCYRSLIARHPELVQFPEPDFDRAALMRANCKIVTILDYTKGFGHADQLTIGMSGVAEMQPSRPDDWGFNPSEIRKGRYQRGL